jgi:RNA polymerase sigma-70 factor (ECF subfamily)
MEPSPTPQAQDAAALACRQDADTWLDEHGDALYRYARSRVGERELAEDLVQETLLAALQSQDEFQGRSTVRTWLLAILRRKVVDHYRRLWESHRERGPESRSHSRERPDPPRARSFSTQGLWTSPPTSWKTPEKALETREFWAVLEGCLSRLPRSLSSAFILRELEGLEMTEVRRILALSEGNLRVRLHRARLLLRECLERRWFARESGRKL